LTSPSGKQYIGLTTNFKKRMRNHLRSNSNTKIYHAINKYGFDNFKKEVLIEVADPNLLPQLEIFYIKIYNTYKNGYNMTLGGEGTFGQIPWNKGKKRKPFSEEHKRKLSEATKGENNPMYGKHGKDNPNYGKPRSEETRRKWSESRKGNVPWNKGLTKETDYRVKKYSETLKIGYRNAR